MGQLTPRERVLMAVEHREPDRVPIDFASRQYLICDLPPYGYRKLCEYLNITDYAEPIVHKSVVLNPDERLQQELGNDFRAVRMGAPKPDIISERSIRMYPYGTYYRSAGLYWLPDFENAPLKEAKTIDDIENYPYWPDPDDPVYTAGLREVARKLHEKTAYAILGDAGHASYFCHLYHFLRGFEQWFVDMKRNPDLYRALMDKIVGCNIELAKRFYGAVGDYIDVAQVSCDDMGWQQGPFLSPKDYKQFVKPWAAKYVTQVRTLTKAKMFYHCDGSIAPLIEDFIDIGVEIISPVLKQGRDMEPEKLKKRYGDRICFHSGIDVQEVLPFGTVDEVRDHVQRVIRELAPGGGYIFAVNDIKPEVTPQNITAAYKTAQEFGRYPIR
jgi:uroporphyrinogen decarboxylase